MTLTSRRELANQSCRPLPEGTPPTSPSDVSSLLALLPGWRVEGAAIARDYTFHDYQSCVRWFGVVAELAEANNHHPDVLVRWGRVTVTFWTHTVNGLSLNDFILAAKLEEAYERL